MKSVQDGVQMRFTMGQMPAKWSSSPAAMPITPAAMRRPIGIRGVLARNHWPAASPRIMVPSVGMKLSVR